MRLHRQLFVFTRKHSTTRISSVSVSCSGSGYIVSDASESRCVAAHDCIALRQTLSPADSFNVR